MVDVQSILTTIINFVKSITLVVRTQFIAPIATMVGIEPFIIALVISGLLGWLFNQKNKGVGAWIIKSLIIFAVVWYI